MKRSEGGGPLAHDHDDFHRTTATDTNTGCTLDVREPRCLRLFTWFGTKVIPKVEDTDMYQRQKQAEEWVIHREVVSSV